MRGAVIAGAARTAIGSFGGTLASVSPIDLGVAVVKEAVRRAGISPDRVEEVIMGQILQAGLGQGPARQVAIKSGIPAHVPAMTVNKLCGSALKSIALAAQAVRDGEADIVVAGGMESMSLAPYLLDRARQGYRLGHGTLYDTMIGDGLTDAFNDYHMGVTAENLAVKYGITREEQDDFAFLSQRKCAAALAEDRFAEEIVPVTVPGKKEPIVFTRDEYPKPSITREQLASMKPAFKKDGTVTAGNSSGINDGAAAVVVMGEDTASRLGVEPLASIAGWAVAGVDPSIMGIGPAFSTRKLLKKLGISLEDVDLVEANEAFAAQSLAVGRELQWDPSKVNPNGGAIALGHPIGASGARILVTLIYEMRRRKCKRGLATLCIGGGMGISMIVEM
ncbi:MAG: acetyl-CoA C-acetyltransferase [Firmicutes bacterium]|nr:acetyl-CoA C-acetyltransferase [Bacillota bacterium]